MRLLTLFEAPQAPLSAKAARKPLAEMVRQVQIGQADLMQVIENPNRAQMEVLRQKGGVRCLLDMQDNMFAWEARKATHFQMVAALGLTARLGGVIHDSCLGLSVSEAEVARLAPEIEQIRSLQRALGPDFSVYSTEW